MSCKCYEFANESSHFQVVEKYRQIFHVLRKLVELLGPEISSCVTGRHLELFEYYFALKPTAHFVNDLPYVCRLLELIPAKMYENDVFKEYYEKYLYLSGIPPMMIRSSEKLTYARDLEELFTTLGSLLFYLKDQEHRFIVLRSILSLMSDKVKWPRCYVSIIVLKEAAASSLLSSIVGRFLTIVNDEMYEIILEICILLADFSKKACYNILKEGALDALLIRMEPTWRERNDLTPPPPAGPGSKVCFYETSSTLIWLLLKSLKGTNNVIKERNLPPPTKYALWSLRYVLKCFYCNSRAKVDRNNMLAILFQIIKLYPATQLIQSGLAKDIIELNLIVEEARKQYLYWPPVEITNCTEDFIFVRLLLMFFPHFVRTEYHGGLQYLKGTGIIGLKMKVMEETHWVKWRNDQADKLICLVLTVLADIADYNIETFLAEKGLHKVLRIVPTDDHNVEVRLALIKSLIIFSQIDKIKSRMIMNRLLDIRAHNIVTEYCEAIAEKTSLSQTYQLVVAYSFVLIEKMYKCKNKLTNQRVMDLSLKCLRRVRKPEPQDPIMLPTLPIMILASLWNVLLCDEQNLTYFIRQQGVYIILDIAERCVWPVKIVALGLLSELADETLAVPFFVTWRSSKHQKIVPFLLEIFREENRMIGAKHDEHGVILDYELPLMGAEQYEYIVEKKNNLEYSPAIADMVASCRPKVYTILQMLIYRHEEEVNMANEIYKMWNDELSVEDQITEIIAENYFALKIAEVWKELQLNFERRGIRPIGRDYEMMLLILRKARKWGIYLQGKQQDILRINKENEEIKENILYTQLRDARLGDALAACREMDYIARCTKDTYRLKCKRKKNMHLIENAVTHSDPNILYHTTFMYSIMVNPVFDQILHLSNMGVKTQVEKNISKLSMKMKRLMQKQAALKYDHLPEGESDNYSALIIDY